jgi:hypothetical protein
LEYGRATISNRQNRKRPAVVLQTMTKMINETAVFAKTNLGSNVTLKNSIAVANNDFPAMQLLHITNNHIEEDVLSNLYDNWSAGKQDRRRMFSEIALGLVDILHTYFSHIIAAFHASAHRDEWFDTSQLFLEELKNELKSIKF